MGSINGEETMMDWEVQDSSAHEEKIYVAVRLRPLNDRELSKHDVSDWECINNTTVIFKNTLQERSLLPTAYTFDRVFGHSSCTRQVYEEAAKKVALSVMSGINSTIFAYGQTGSGKTFTMSGITEHAIADIYDYIDKHCERNFVLKFSAMEIYNEAVKDLLRSDGSPLRLLDDPERGTIVDKLTEVTLRDLNHLKELLSICAAQRQIGETSLNELSSRSHQILRLTVESEARHYLGADSSSTLTAAVNFVDLAGSERASQTLSAGTRLKEGCHINRSLLTLGTVIRKLSKGRNAHIPYRDSKLTRILQNSLGGNARTAIICTMSPAHSHVEQSRNTLHFASCAKQVSTNAQVNVVMSEKALVKQLQRELARLENELRNLTSLSASGASTSVLREKEQLIQKMEKEITNLTHQRDEAHSRVEDMLRMGDFQTPKSWVYMNNHDKGSWTDEYSISEESEIIDPLRFEVASRTSHFSDRCAQGVIPSKIEEEQFLSDDTSPRLYIEKYFGPDPCQAGWEKITQETNNNSFKKVQCIQVNDIIKSNSRKGGRSLSLSEFHASSPSAKVERIKSCQAIFNTIMDSATSQVAKESAYTIEKEADDQEILSYTRTMSRRYNLSRDNSRHSIRNELQNENDLQEACVKQVTEPMSTKEVYDLDVMKEEAKVVDECKTQDTKQSTSDWSNEFERLRREIIQLWDACHVSLAHRTYFFLLFKGDPSDAVYMEVELRRLSFLSTSIHAAGVDDQIIRRASSQKSLNREREALSKKMLRKFSTKEREALYEKWGIDVKSKQRRLQLCRKLWSDPTNMEHINESAAIVAKLVGLKEQGQAPKELFGLSFLPKLPNSRSFLWKHNLPSII